jgi:uncharacterized protein YkuJ
MRIIQSIWTGNTPDLLRNPMGWLAPEYNLMSWTLSCLQLREYYTEVALYCDSASAELLIDILQLPYSEVVCELDSLNAYHPELWALSKIKAYSLQDQPFLHVDGDVYIWEKFEERLIQSDLIAQNKDQIASFEVTMHDLEQALDYFPEEITQERVAKNPIQTYNAGIYGGCDIGFFQEYTRKAFEFVDRNSTNLSKIDVSDFNIIFEQYLFYCLAKDQNKPVTTLLAGIIKDDEYKGFGEFDKVPFQKRYLHLLSDYKKSEYMCNELANRLRHDYPAYYYRIIELFKKNEIPLYKNYNFFDTYLQKNLVLSNSKLKTDFLNTASEKKQTATKSQNYNKITVDSIIDTNSKNQLDQNQLQDITVFCENINAVVTNKFWRISDDYLYGRDLNKTNYFEALFEDMKAVYNKKIVADSIFETIESSYDWSYYFEKNGKLSLNVNPLPSKESATIHTLLIPECDSIGFSVYTIDDLDLVLLEIVQNPITITTLFKELKPYFDEDDWNDSKVEFELLLFKKINNAIQNKSIRVLP